MSALESSSAVAGSAKRRSRLASAVIDLFRSKDEVRRRRMLEEAADLRARFSAMTSDELKDQARELSRRYRRGEPYDALPQAVMLVSELSRRLHGTALDDDEIAAAFALAEGTSVEVAPGPRKNAVLAGAACFLSLAGKGVHVAARSAEAAGRLFNDLYYLFGFLDVTVGHVEGSMNAGERRTQYGQDVTVVPQTELGFDFLRARIQARNAMLEGRLAADDASGEFPSPWAVLFADLDLTMIDEGATPLIIAGTSDAVDRQLEALERWCAVQALDFTPKVHFVTFDDVKQCELTNAGRDRLRDLTKAESLGGLDSFRIHEYMEHALSARTCYERGRDYEIRDGRLIVCDAQTRAEQPGRRYQDGMQHALEARNGIDLTQDVPAVAKLTFPGLYLSYPLAAGIVSTERHGAAILERCYGWRIRRAGEVAPGGGESRARRWYEAVRRRFPRIPPNIDKRRLTILSAVYAHARDVVAFHREQGSDPFLD